MKKLVFTFIALMCCMVTNAQNIEFTVDPYTYYIRSENTVEIHSTSISSGRAEIPTTVKNPNDGKIYNVTRIGDACFLNKGITSVTIPEGITSIGQSAFYRCQITDLVIPSTVKSIERQAFEYCSDLTSVTIKSGSIGKEAFSGCSNLTSISLQEGVTSIGEQAFIECKKIAGDLVIPSTVTSIGKEAFYFVAVNTIKVFALVPPELGDGAFYQYYNLYAPDVEKYKVCDGWKNFQNIKLLTDFRLGDQMYALGEKDGGRYLDQELTFNDKVSYMSYFDFTANKLTYSRTFKATGVWQAWFVPFDVKVSDMKKAGMEVAEIAGVLMDEKEPYIAFAKMTNTDAIVKANTPYVVKATESSVSMTLTGPDIRIRKSTDAELETQRLTVQSSYNTFTFGGNYHPTNGYENKWYALNTSGVFQKMGKDANLAPQRFWMTIATRTDTPYYTEEFATAKAFIGMTVLGDDETTGITSYENDNENENDNGVIYNLNGQRVTSIQKGQVYIMNGKKYLAR